MAVTPVLGGLLQGHAALFERDYRTASPALLAPLKHTASLFVAVANNPFTP